MKIKKINKLKELKELKNIKSFVISLFLLSAFSACTSTKGLQELKTTQTLTRDVPSESLCGSERYFFKSIINGPDQVGFISLNKLSKAIQKHRKILVGVKNIQNRCYYNLLILNLLVKGRTNEALKWGRKILTNFPQAVLARYFIALGYFLKNQIYRAEHIIESILTNKNSPHLGMVYNLQGLIKYKRGDHVAAAISFKESVLHSLDYQIASRLNLAFLALRYGDGRTAVVSLKYLADKFDVYEVFYGLGLGYYLVADYESAFRFLNKAADINSHHSLTYYYLGLISYNYFKESNKAGDYFEKFLKIKDDAYYRKYREVSRILNKIKVKKNG